MSYYQTGIFVAISSPWKDYRRGKFIGIVARNLMVAKK